MNVSRRWWISVPFILAIATLLFLGWGISLALKYPYDGILSLYSTGLIREIDPDGPAANRLIEGDVIQTVDGVPVVRALPFYVQKQGGDEVVFWILRDQKLESVTIRLVEPSLEEKQSRLMPFFVGLIFWFIGLGVLAFSPSDAGAKLFFFLCQASSILLAAGSASYQGPPWISSIFVFMIWILGPLAVHFHMYFPQSIGSKMRHAVVGCLYGVAGLFGLPYLAIGGQRIRETPWYPWFYNGGLIYLALSLGLVVILLIYANRHAATTGVRAKIRIVVLGGVASLLPVIVLTLFPDVLLKQPVISYTYAMLLLGLVPVTYGYAIVRHRLVEIDKHVNRGATFILVFSILCAFYLVLYAAVQRWLPAAMFQTPLVNTLLVLILASVFLPLRQRVQRLVDTVFYGGWYDYRTAVSRITQGLEEITDLESLAETVCERLVRTLRLEESCVFLRDLEGTYSVIAVAPRSKLGVQKPIAYPVLPKNSLTYLLRYGMIERSSLRKALAPVTLFKEERELINSEQVYLLAPIIGHEQVLGLLALGPKFGGDIFSGEDLEILRVVAKNTSPLIENIHLVTRLKRHAADLEKRVTQRTEELYAAKERVEAILASVGEGVVVTDLDWNIVTVNAAFEGQSGYPASEIIHHKIWDFIEVQEPRSRLDKVIAILQQGQIWSGELSSRRKDGHPYDVLLTMSPVRNQERQVMGYVASQRDITRQMELDRLKDRLIFDVSHELRTPVTNINLFLELLERGPEKKAEYIEVLKGESQRLIELIESTLDLSRLDMWKSKKMELSAIDLNLVAEQVVAAHRLLAETSGLELIFTPGDHLPLVRGEQNQLARLVTNLLSNAILYTLCGQVCLRTFQKGGEVCMQVQDTGVGMVPEDLAHIFDRFYRGQQISQSRINGTGLGLSIVKEIIEIHEGRIEVESDLGKGSTFSVWLPAEPMPEKTL